MPPAKTMCCLVHDTLSMKDMSCSGGHRVLLHIILQKVLVCKTGAWAKQQLLDLPVLVEYY